MKISFDNPRAYAPFFTEHVTVKAVRTGGVDCGGVFRCFIVEKNDDEPLDVSLSPSSMRLTVSVHIPRTGPGSWDDCTQDAQPRTGDKLEFDDGRVFAVTAVKKDELCYYLAARTAAKGGAR